MDIRGLLIGSLVLFLSGCASTPWYQSALSTTDVYKSIVAIDSTSLNGHSELSRLKLRLSQLKKSLMYIESDSGITYYSDGLCIGAVTLNRVNNDTENCAADECTAADGGGVLLAKIAGEVSSAVCLLGARGMKPGYLTTVRAAACAISIGVKVQFAVEPSELPEQNILKENSPEENNLARLIRAERELADCESATQVLKDRGSNTPHDVKQEIASLKRRIKKLSARKF